MPCALTQGYNLDCKDSYGGVKDIFIMELANAVTITSGAGIVTGITKAATRLFYKYNLIVNTADGNDNLTNNRENGSTIVNQTISFPINKMTVSVRNELLLLAQARLLIVLVDQNGLGWLYGRDNGMMISTISGKTGKTLADRNGYEFAFEGTEKELALNVNAATLLTLQTAGV